MMINSDSHGREISCKAHAWKCLQDGAAAFFPKGVDLLAGEADEQTILLLMFGDVFNNVRDGLGNRQPLDGSFATELFRHHPKN